MSADASATRDPQERERDHFSRLPDTLLRAARAPLMRAHLGDHDLHEVASREALAKLPVLRKPDLMAMQEEDPPFGGLVDGRDLQSARIFQSPGPVWEVERAGADPWNAARAFRAAGFGASDVVHVALAYDRTPGGFILDSGARVAGATVFPAGTGGTDAQVDAIASLKATGYAGTPDYLKALLDDAGERGIDVSSLRKALVSGGALFPAMRAEYAERGVDVMQMYATADLGVIAYETKADGELVEGMVVNEDLILEIVRPGTDDPVGPGVVGEVVVTRLGAVTPLVRFGTGDMSALIETPSPCGRTNLRIKGWMGRADQRTKVKGMFVDPKQIDAVLKKHDLTKGRLVVTRDGDRDAMELRIEGDGEGDAEAIAETLRKETGLKGTVSFAHDLPNDGKIVSDERDYES